MKEHSKNSDRDPNDLPEKGKEPAKDGWIASAPVHSGAASKRNPKKAGPAYSLDDLFLFDPTFESCW